MNLPTTWTAHLNAIQGKRLAGPGCSCQKERSGLSMRCSPCPTRGSRPPLELSFVFLSPRSTGHDPLGIRRPPWTDLCAGPGYAAALTAGQKSGISRPRSITASRFQHLVEAYMPVFAPLNAIFTIQASLRRPPTPNASAIPDSHPLDIHEMYDRPVMLGKSVEGRHQGF